MYLEHSLCTRNTHKQFDSVIQKYFDLGHAEPVPSEDLNKPEHKVFHLPLHVVYKASSTTQRYERSSMLLRSPPMVSH